MTLIFSCEHAGNRVPLKFKKLFTGRTELLESHRGYDLGIRQVFGYFKRRFGVPSISTGLSRLLIDQNRSRENSGLFSEISSGLSVSRKAWLLDRHRRYETALEKRILRGLNDGAVLHVSFHSFTPVFDGEVRAVDFGILFDPVSAAEHAAAQTLFDSCSGTAGLTVRFNEPYLGTDDGMCTLFRARYATRGYAGIELEFNQRDLHPVINGKGRALIECVGRWLEEMQGRAGFEAGNTEEP